jgi:hypothetical protein
MAHGATLVIHLVMEAAATAAPSVLGRRITRSISNLKYQDPKFQVWFLNAYITITLG